MVMMVLTGCKRGPMGLGEPSLSDACSYLWDQQQRDGAWHSETHALLKGGQALTPFVLWALMEVPDSIYHKKPRKIQKAINFLRRQVDQYGHLGKADQDLLEYPNYSSAYALMVLSRYGSMEDQPRIQKLQQYLVSQQFAEHRGIEPHHLTYGGWGFGEDLAWGEHGQVDLSHTRRVLQALQVSGYTMDSLKGKSHHFLHLLQKHPQETRPQPALLIDTLNAEYDGGFYYSPVVLGANKGQQDLTGQFMSYPTATCDGFLAWQVFGAGCEESKDALEWLIRHPSWDKWDHLNEQAQTWARAMQYYHIMVRTEVYLQAQYHHDWVSAIPHWLGQKQRADGSFVNPVGAISKENDPLLTTTMAVTALNNCREIQQLQHSKLAVESSLSGI